MKISTAINQFVVDIHVDALPHWIDMFEVDLDDTDNEAEMRIKLAEAMSKARAA